MKIAMVVPTHVLLVKLALTTFTSEFAIPPVLLPPSQSLQPPHYLVLLVTSQQLTVVTALELLQHVLHVKVDTHCWEALASLVVAMDM